MCETSRAAVAGPRWGALYAATFPPLTALAIVEVAGPVGVIRTALRLALALGAFAGMAVWVRANRAAFDLQHWCDCAGRTMTVRVIGSSSEPHRDVDAELPEVVLLPEIESLGVVRVEVADLGANHEHVAELMAPADGVARIG